MNERMMSEAGGMVEDFSPDLSEGKDFPSKVRNRGCPSPDLSNPDLVMIDVERITNGTGLLWRARRLYREDVVMSIPLLTALALARKEVTEARKALYENRKVQAAARPVPPRLWKSSPIGEEAPVITVENVGFPEPRTVVSFVANESGISPEDRMDLAIKSLKLKELENIPILRGLGNFICSSRNPFFAAARKLKEQGLPDDTPMAMRHLGSPVIAMIGNLGVLAGLTTQEGDRGMRTIPFREFTGMRDKKIS